MKQLIRRNFKIWAYTVSHSTLLLRSEMKYPDQEGFDIDSDFNIDIEFSLVEYMDIPANFADLQIKTCNKLPDHLSSLSMKHRLSKIFELHSGNENFYVIAANYRVGTNRWINEDRLSNMKLEYDSILEEG